MAILNANVSKSFSGGPSFSLRHRVMRIGWRLTWFFFAVWTPTSLHGWRRFLLRLFGARIGHGVNVYSSVRVWYPPNLVMDDYSCLGPRVDCYCMDQIAIGKHVVVSQGAYLCAGSHDINSESFQLIAEPIVIADRAWIAAEAFVGPGVRVGRGAVLGARGVTFADLEDWTVYRGNPAVPIKKRAIVR